MDKASANQISQEIVIPFHTSARNPPHLTSPSVMVVLTNSLSLSPCCVQLRTQKQKTDKQSTGVVDVPTFTYLIIIAIIPSLKNIYIYQSHGMMDPWGKNIFKE